MDSQPALMRAAGMILAAMAVIGVIDNFVVVIAEHAGLWQFHVTRSSFALPVIVGLALIFGQRIRPIRARAVALRSVLIMMSMLLYFGSLAILPIAEVTAGLFTAPIFVLIASAVFFGVRIGPVRVASVALGFTGIVLILKPGSESFSLISLMPVLAGVFYALNAVVTHHLCRRESTATLLFWFFLLIGTVSAVMLGVLIWQSTGDSFFTQGWVRPTPTFLWLVLAQALGAILGVGLVTKAYQTADASYVSIFEYSLLIFAGIVAYVLRGEVPDPWAIAGIVLIVMAGVLITLRTRKAQA